MSATTTKARSRTKKRLLEIKDHLNNLDTIAYIRKRLREKPLLGNEESTAVVQTMLELELLDDYTSPYVFDRMVDKLPAMEMAVCRCVRGNGLDLISTVLQQDPREETSSPHAGSDRTIPQTFELGRTNYTTAIKCPEDKCIFWTFSVAFFILYYRYITGDLLRLPVTVTNDDFDDFFSKYPEFVVRSWDASDLLQFRLVMKHIVNMYGNGNNKACLVEMVTRITRGRAIALTCNTSGGAMKKETIYNDETEVAAECCRVRIYQRESGVAPRKRDHPQLTDAPDSDINSSGVNSSSSSSGVNASGGAKSVPMAELKRVPTSDIRMIAGLNDAFQHDTFPQDAPLMAPAKRHRSNPEYSSIYDMGMPKPMLERRNSSGRSQNSGIESILLAAAGNEDLFDLPDMSRTISEDINRTVSIGNGGQQTYNNDGDDQRSLLFPNKPMLTKKFSTNSNSSQGSIGLTRISSAGLLDAIGNNSPPDFRSGGPPKACRVNSTDWPQYPLSQLK